MSRLLCRYSEMDRWAPNGRNAPPPPFAPDRDLIGNMEDKAAPA
jgi:hypothetical protein